MVYSLELERRHAKECTLFGFGALRKALIALWTTCVFNRALGQLDHSWEATFTGVSFAFWQGRKAGSALAKIVLADHRWRDCIKIDTWSTKRAIAVKWTGSIQFVGTGSTDDIGVSNIGQCASSTWQAVAKSVLKCYAKLARHQLVEYWVNACRQVVGHA